MLELVLCAAVALGAMVAWKLYPPIPDELVLQLRTDTRFTGTVSWQDGITQQQYRAPFDSALDGQLIKPRPLEITVTSIPPLNASSRSTEVWVYNIQTAERLMTDPSRLQVGAGWSQRMAQLVGSLPIVTIALGEGERDPLRYTVQSAGQWAAVHLAHHAWSGSARVSVNGHGQDIDLYGEGNLQVQSHLIVLPPQVEELVEIAVPVYRVGTGRLIQIELDSQDGTAYLHGVEQRGMRPWQWRPTEGGAQPIISGAGSVAGVAGGALELQLSAGGPTVLAFQGLPPLIVFSWIDALVLIGAALALLLLWRALWYLGGGLLRILPRVLEAPIPLWPGQRPPWLVVGGYLGLMLVIIALQAAFVVSRPILLSVDSGDYLVGGRDVYRAFDFSSARDWRQPGYLAFVAGAYHLFGYELSSIILAQAAVLCAACGAAFLIGRMTGGWYVGMALSLFTALHPGLLLTVNTAMSEALTIGVIMPTILLGWLLFVRPFSWGVALLFGLCAGLALLVRQNLLVVVLPILLFAGLRGAWQVWRSDRRIRAGLQLALVFALFGVTYLGPTLPWMLRNQELYGALSLGVNSQRGRLLMLDQHRLIDDRLPLIQEHRGLYRYNIAGLAQDFHQVVQAPSVLGAEARARELVQEQLQARPGVYLYTVVRSAGHLVGFENPNAFPSQSIQTYLLNNVAFEADAWDERNRVFSYAWLTDYVGLPQQASGSDSWVTSFWQGLWIYGYSYSRRLLAVVWLISLVACLAVAARDDRRSRPDMLGNALFFSLIYVAVVAGHAVNLAQHDRYMVPFEWIPAAAVLLQLRFLSHWMRLRRASRSALPQGRQPATPPSSVKPLGWVAVGAMAMAAVAATAELTGLPLGYSAAALTMQLVPPALAGAAVGYVLVYRIIAPRIAVVSPRERGVLLGGSLALAALLVYVVPIPPPRLPSHHTLEITATGERDSRAQGAEVWVLGFGAAAGGEDRLRSLTPPEGWQWRDDALFAADGGAERLRWDGYLADDARVLLRAHPWSGAAIIKWDGQEQQVNLYAGDFQTRGVVLPYSQPSTLLSLVGAALYVAAIGVLILAMGLWAVERGFVEQMHGRPEALR